METILRSALHYHQPHPDWSLYIARALYLIAHGRGTELPPLETEFLSDLLVLYAEEAEEDERNRS